MNADDERRDRGDARPHDPADDLSPQAEDQAPEEDAPSPRPADAGTEYAGEDGSDEPTLAYSSTPNQSATPDEWDEEADWEDGDWEDGAWEDEPDAQEQTEQDQQSARAGAAAHSDNALTRNPIRTVLAAIVVGALIAGGIAFAMGTFDDGGSLGDTAIGEGTGPDANAMSESTPGDCLDWPAGDAGNLELVDCAGEHRFEVAGALDTAVLPGAEFGEDANWPGPARFSEIRNEQCTTIVDRYLDGRFDQQGRFSIGLLYPSEAQWNKGARELRCGLELTASIGAVDPANPTPPDPAAVAQAQFSGKVGEQDQSFQWAPGTCIGIDPETRRPAGPASGVDCAEEHAFQTAGIVDLAPQFGDRLAGRPWPDAETQNGFVGDICQGLAERFVGGAENLRATTLNVQWSVLSEGSWLAGSRKAVCYLGLPDRGGFAALTGDVRESLLINGEAPRPAPQAPPGRALPTPVPLPEGIAPNPQEVPAPG